MKQIKIWIEVCPLNDWGYVGFTHNDNSLPLRNKISELFDERVDRFCADIFKLKDGESRETIIEALREHQKSILPENWSFIIANGEIIFHNEKKDKAFPFYSLRDRVINIIMFEEGE